MDNFINAKILKRLKIERLRLHVPKTIWNVDGTHNKAGTITECVNLQVRVGDQKEQMRFLITNPGEDEIVLGYPWLAAFQSKINWKNVVLDESMQPLVIKTLEPKLDEEVAQIQTSWVSRTQDLAKPGEEIFVLKLDEEQLRRMSTSMEMAVKALPKKEKTWDQIVPPQYHKWKKVFSEKDAK